MTDAQEPENGAPIEFNALRDTYYEATATASELARKLGFGGLALVWLFSGGGTQDARQVHIDGAFRWPAFLFVVALTLDLTQYIYRSAGFGFYQWYLEKYRSTKSEDRVLLPRTLNWPHLLLFWMKLAAVFVGYVMLLFELGDRLT